MSFESSFPRLAPPAIFRSLSNLSSSCVAGNVDCGGLGGAYLLPTLSFVGASLTPPCFRFHTPLIEPDVRACLIRLSEKTHAIAVAIACDAVCIF